MGASLSAMAQNHYEWVFLNSKPDRVELPKEQVDSLMRLHMGNMTKLAEAGHLQVAGPFYGGGGIFVFNTDPEMTDSLVQTDPAVQANRWNVEQYTWYPLVGDICVQSVDQEMTTYSFDIGW